MGNATRSSEVPSVGRAWLHGCEVVMLCLASLALAACGGPATPEVAEAPSPPAEETEELDGQLDCQGPEVFSAEALRREGARGAPTAQEAVSAALDGYLEEGDELVATGPRTGSVVRDGREIVHATAKEDRDGWFAGVAGCSN